MVGLEPNIIEKLLFIHAIFKSKMPGCCAYGCTNHSDKKGQQFGSSVLVTFHR